MIEDTRTTTATATFPDVRFEVLWNQGPDVSDGDWCDISHYVVGGQSVVGRGIDESERFQSGDLSLTLETQGSEGRLFDPENTAGPFYPWLRPMVQVRVTAMWNDSLRCVWRGYVTSWGQTHVQDKKFVTTVRARDAFERLNRMPLPSSWLELAISKDRPTHWWRLDEASGTVASDSGYGSTLYDAYYVNSPTLSDATVVPYDGGRQGVTLDGTPTQYVSIPGQATEAASTYSIEVWFTRAGAVGGSEDALVVLGTILASGSYAALAMTAGGIVAWDDGDAIVGALDVAMTSGRHQAVVTRSGSTVKFYLDGVLTETDTTAMGGLPTNRWLVGSNYAMQGGAEDSGWNGGVANLAFWSGTVLTADQVAAHYNAGMLAHSGDDTGTHIGRVLDYKGWPSALRDLDTGASTVGAYELSAGNVLEFVQRMADTELGRTFVEMADFGKVAHQSRTATVTEARSITSQGTWGDKHSGGTILFADVEPMRDETLIRNPVSASKSGGATFTADDRALIENRFGDRGWTAPTAYDANENTVAARAQWLLGRFKDERTRIPSVTFEPTQNASILWPEILDRRIGDRVTVKRTPLGTGNQVTLDMTVERIAHRFTPRTWTTTYALAAAQTSLPALWDDGLWDDGLWGY